MRLPDLSGGPPVPSADMDPESRGRLLLRYVADQRSLQGMDFHTAALRGVSLRGAAMAGVRLVDANLSGADLQGVQLSGALLERANLQHARMGQAELRNARLPDAQLDSAQLVEADLRYADLRRARLHYANMVRADLRSAVLTDAMMQRVRLRMADLRGADLRGADLRWADLLGAKVDGAHIDPVGARRAGWSAGDLQDLQGRGLVVSTEPPAPPAASPRPAGEAAVAPAEGLLLRWEAPLSPTQTALLQLAVAAWREAEGDRDATVSPQHPPMLVTATEPDELEALALMMCESRWAEIRLDIMLQPRALDALSALVAQREAFQLWIHKSDGLRPVLSW